MKIEFHPWPIPDHLSAVMPPRLRQEGFKAEREWRLSSVDAATLAHQCDVFRAEVFRVAGKIDPRTTREGQ